MEKDGNNAKNDDQEIDESDFQEQSVENLGNGSDKDKGNDENGYRVIHQSNNQESNTNDGSCKSIESILYYLTVLNAISYNTNQYIFNILLKIKS